MKPYQWPMLVLYAAAIFSQSKSFRDNPVIGSTRLNTMGLHLFRRRLAARMGARRRAQLASRITAEDRAAIDRDGYIVKRDFLDPQTFAALRDEILGLQTHAREAVIGDTLTRLIPLDVWNLRKVPTTRTVLEGPDFNDLFAYAGSFKRRPRLFVQTVFTQVLKDAPPDVQSFFHSDTFHPTVKAWLYLDDVDPASCPFTYVPGSHLANRRRLAWERRVSFDAATSADPLTAEGSLRVTEAELARLGYAPPVSLAVGANSLVIADTSGFHKRATSADQARRISIWAYSRSNPFLPWAGGDLTRLLPAAHSAGLHLFWFAQDQVKRMRKARGGWRWVGVRTPATPPVLETSSES
ncbi:phytanoyl-CoA dioxygenase family protein [Pararobbsia silviterrae]|nr:phytanoyl-CoA dioxygenase family protein [Pararobbsia silviterrae]